MTDRHDVIPAADQLPARRELHPAFEKFDPKIMTPEALEKLFELQRQWEKDEAKRAYTQALVKLKRALPVWISRDQVVDYQRQGKPRVRYTHASLAHAVETVQPHLNEFGFSLTWKTSTDKGSVTVEAKLIHEAGHSETSSLSAPPETGGNKSAPQAVASTVTLLERYTALALLGLATKDMKEPGAPPPPEGGAVDTSRNLRAMADLKKRGKTKDEAEKLVGRPVQEWTGADLETLRDWVDPPKTEETTSPPTARSPGPVVVDFEKLGKWRKTNGLTQAQMLQLVRNEIGLHIHGAQQLTPEEFGRLQTWFERVGKRGDPAILDRDTLTFGEIPSTDAPGPGEEKGEPKPFDPKKPDEIPF